MRTFNLYRACFTVMMLALLALGCVLSNGCKSPGTNSVAVGNLGTNIDSGQKSLDQLTGVQTKETSSTAGLKTNAPASTIPDSKTGVPIEIILAIITAISSIIFYFVRKVLEERSIKIAILAEIRRLITVILKHQEIRKSESAKPVLDIHEPLIPFSHPVYTEHVKNIGVLKDSVALAVEFYGWVDFLNNFQAKQKEYAARKQSKKFERHYDKILTNIRDRFEHAFDDEFKKYGIPKS
jgi:hypothetical protein